MLAGKRFTKSALIFSGNPKKAALPEKVGPFGTSFPSAEKIYRRTFFMPKEIFANLPKKFYRSDCVRAANFTDALRKYPRPFRRALQIYVMAIFKKKTIRGHLYGHKPDNEVAISEALLKFFR